MNSAPHVHEIIERLVAEKGYSLKTSDDELDLISIIEQAPSDLLMILVQMGEQANGLHRIEDTDEHYTLLPPAESQQNNIDEEKI